MTEKIDLDDPNVVVHTLTLAEARDPEPHIDDFLNALDVVQAHVFSGTFSKSYLVIQIVPEDAPA